MTTFRSFIANHIKFNTWANNNYAIWLTGLSDEILLTAVNKNSIISIVQHITKAQQFWTLFLKNKNIADFIWRTEIIDLKFEIKMLQESGILLEKVCMNFSDDELLELIKFETSWAKNKLQRFDYIVHCVNHSTHHRGQIALLANKQECRYNIPNTEYSLYLGNLQRN